jgi:hypothetical protein
MWPTEFMINEQHKEMQRVAAQVSLARSVQMPRRHWLAAVFNLIVIRRPRPVESVESPAQTQPVVLGRVC